MVLHMWSDITSAVLWFDNLIKSTSICDSYHLWHALNLKRSYSLSHKKNFKSAATNMEAADF